MGRLSISSNRGVSGTSTTNFQNFSKLVQSWKDMGATVITKGETEGRVTSVEAHFKDGCIRWAYYIPHHNEFQS